MGTVFSWETWFVMRGRCERERAGLAARTYTKRTIGYPVREESLIFRDYFGYRHSRVRSISIEPNRPSASSMEYLLRSTNRGKQSWSISSTAACTHTIS